MLLRIGSLLLVLLIVGYCMFHFNRYKDKVSNRIGFATSLLTGVSAGSISFLLIQMTNYNLPLTIVGSLLFTIVIGFLIRIIFSQQNGVNEWLSGLLGVIVGTVISYMLFISSKPIFMLDIAFILFIYLLLMLFDKQIVIRDTRSKKKKKVAPPSKTPTILLTCVLVIALILLVFNVNQIKIGVIGQPQSQVAKLEQDDNLQVATINITRTGINPKNTTIKANIMVKLIIDVDGQLGKSHKLVSNSLNMSANLKPGKNVILLDNPQKGAYDYSVQPENYSGTITVKVEK